MQYTKPNLNREWNEARRYSFLKKMGKKAWVEFASKNFQILNYESIKDQLGNVDLDYENLDKDKKIRFERDFKKGVIEIPIAVKIYEDYYDLVGGNTRLAGLIKNNINPKLWVIDATDKIDVEDPIEESKNIMKKENKESTDASSSGAFSAPLGAKNKGLGKVIKKPISGLKNSKKYNVEQDMDEATDASSSGAYDVPFGAGGKSPLKIGGPSSVKTSRAVKDKNFPKWGGPGGVYVAVKEKCKKFPYCNQGDINSLEFISEVEGLKEAINEVAKKHGFSPKEVEKLVLNEIKQIFI
jgi:hypothetical protein